MEWGNKDGHDKWQIARMQISYILNQLDCDRPVNN